MSTIYFAVALSLVLIHLSAITVIGSQLAPAPIARFGGILALALVLFAVEHFAGLGPLHGLWPLTTVASLYLLRRHASRAISCAGHEAVFLVCLGYALIWKLVDANIDPLGESLTDLYFVSNYLAGETLPPGDRWMGGTQPFDFYYGFQFYTAALLGRAFALSPGFTLNLAGVLAYAVLGSLAWFIAASHLRQRWVAGLVVATLLVGGNGLSPLALLSIEHPSETRSARAAAGAEQMWASTRFSGVFEDRVNTVFGHWMRSLDGQGQEHRTGQAAAMDLPLETPAYLLLLGDFHPPVGSWILLLFSLAVFTWIARPDAVPGYPRSSFFASAALAALPWITLATNAWVFPLQAALSMVLLALLALRRRAHAQGALAGTLLALALLYPFLGYFSAGALEVTLKWVPSGMHTRWPIWLGLHWPILVLLCLAGVRMLRRRSADERDALVLGLLVGTLLLASELLFVDDPLAGRHERFNTVLKTWSWLWPLALVALLPPLWSGGQLASRLILVLMCGLLLLNAWNVARYLGNASIAGGSHMGGDGWLRRDAAQDDMLRLLASAPPGVVLERAQAGAYDAAPGFALFAAKPAALGWWQHQALWRGTSPSIASEARAIETFFAGSAPDALGWLRARNIRYIVWSRRDEEALPGMRHRLDLQITADFEFRSVEIRGERQIGFWARRP